MKKALIAIGIIVSLAIIWVIGSFLGLFGHAVGNVKQTSHDIIDKTINADNVLQNYEWFKTQYEGWIKIDQQIKIADQEVVNYQKMLPDDKEKWKFDDKQRLGYLMDVASGLRQQQQNIIAEYNAKSKMQNRSLFKTKDLPYQLDVTPTANGQ